MDELVFIIEEAPETFCCKANPMRRLQTETAAELDALVPFVVGKAFRGEL